MKREEAERGFPVKIQGVVISVVSNRPAFIVQDATRAVYVVVDSATISELPQVGTYLEVEGKTDKGSFAPIVRAREVNVLGLGNCPNRIQPTWDQLMNGSLDDQWVEFGGIVEVSVLHPAGYPNSRSKMTLRTRSGTLWVDVSGWSARISRIWSIRKCPRPPARMPVCRLGYRRQPGAAGDAFGCVLTHLLWTSPRRRICFPPRQNARRN